MIRRRFKLSADVADCRIGLSHLKESKSTQISGVVTLRHGHILLEFICIAGRFNFFNYSFFF